MVSNRTLAQIAEQYEIPQMVIAAQASKYLLQGGEKTKGSLFEAYVAGVYYSYLNPREEDTSTQKEEKGTDFEGSSVRAEDETRVAAPIEVEEDSTRVPLITEDEIANQDIQQRTDPISPKEDEAISPKVPTQEDPTGGNTPSCSISQESSANSNTSSSPTLRPPSPSTSTPRTHGQAFDHICLWLWPLFHPIAEYLKNHLKSQSEQLSLAIGTDPTSLSTGVSNLLLNPQANNMAIVPEDWKVEDMRAIGAIGALNQFLGRTYGCGLLPTWLTKRKGGQVWKMTCIVKTPEGKEM